MIGLEIFDYSSFEAGAKKQKNKKEKAKTGIEREQERAKPKIGTSNALKRPQRH